MRQRAHSKPKPLLAGKHGFDLSPQLRAVHVKCLLPLFHAAPTLICPCPHPSIGKCSLLAIYARRQRLQKLLEVILRHLVVCKSAALEQHSLIVHAKT